MPIVSDDIQKEDNQPSSLSGDKQPSANRIALLIAFVVALASIGGMFSGLKSSFLLKNLLHLSPIAFSTVGIITGIPSYLRPFLGAGSDLFPLFGFHRRSYYVISCLLAAAGSFALAVFHYHVGQVVLLSIVGGLGGNLQFVIMDAVMVSIGNRTGTVGRLQSIQQGIPLIMTVLFGGRLSGYVAQHWSYTACFFAAGVTALAAAPLAVMIEESRVVNARHAQETEEEHRARLQTRREERERTTAALKKAATSPGLWAIVGFVFYLIITPGTGTAQFYYCSNALHFSKEFFGLLQSYGSAGAIAGILLFGFVSRRLPVRAMVWGAFLMDCSLYLVSLGIHDRTSGIVIGVAASVLGMLYTLCLFTLAARATPPGIEGTVYGLVIAAINLGGTLGDWIGATIFGHFGGNSQTSAAIAHGWFGLLWSGFALTLLAAVFIPFLPAWTRSREPLRPA